MVYGCFATLQFATYTCSLPKHIRYQPFLQPIHFRYLAFSLPGTILAIQLEKKEI